MSSSISLSIPNLGGREMEYIRRCVDTNWVSSSGVFVEEFEGVVRRYVKARNAVACVNGTSGLQVALRLCGVGPGDEVIVPTLTFIAPVNAVRYLGAEPVFMDCDKHMNIDCVKLREFCAKECKPTKSGLVNRSTGRRVKAVVPVHIFGNPCGMEEINRTVRKYGLKVVEDATESLGSYYSSGALKGKFTGVVSDIGVYSFNANKIITTGGGGMIVTNDDRLGKMAKYLTEQAKDDPVKYIHNEVGYNFRLSNIQAALGLAQFGRLKDFIAIKKKNFLLYKKLLARVPGISISEPPEGTVSNHWFYPLAIERREFGMGRDEVMERLQSKGIQTRPVWQLNHLQKPYRLNQAYKIENAPKFLKKILNLPCSTCLTERQIRYVVSSLRDLKRRYANGKA